MLESQVFFHFSTDKINETKKILSPDGKLIKAYRKRMLSNNTAIYEYDHPNVYPCGDNDEEYYTDYEKLRELMFNKLGRTGGICWGVNCETCPLNVDIRPKAIKDDGPDCTFLEAMDLSYAADIVIHWLNAHDDNSFIPDVEYTKLILKPYSEWDHCNYYGGATYVGKEAEWHLTLEGNKWRKCNG